MKPKPEELQNVEQYTFNNDEIPLNKAIKADGNRAYLGHPIWRSRLFPVGRRTNEKFWSQKYVNEFGDKCYIFAAERLKPCPDMSVLFTTVALIQHYGQHELSINGKPSGFVGARVPIVKLLKVNHIKTCDKKRLFDSIKRLGSIHITIEYSDPAKHQESSEVVITALWGAEFLADEIVFICHKTIFPKVGKLYRKASTVVSLRSDTARGIFWVLGARQHLKGALSQWRELLGIPCPVREDKWRRNTWLPAISELKSQGYECNQSDIRGMEYWTISVPRPQKSGDSK